MDTVLAYITASSRQEAERLGEDLVKKRVAACVNIIDGMTSLYWWEGKIDRSDEAILIAKTRRPLVDRLIEEVKKQHSYSCPCVLVFPAIAGNPDYVHWLEENAPLS